MNRRTPASGLTHWVFGLIALLLVVPWAVQAQEPPSTGCENPEVLEEETVQFVSHEWRAVLLETGAFAFNEETEFLDQDGNPIGPRAFYPGTPVTAEVCFATTGAERQELPDPSFPVIGVLLSLQKTESDEFVQLEGFLTDIDSTGVIAVNQRRVSTDGDTLYFDGDSEISFSDLALGDFVEVEATRIPSTDSSQPAQLVADLVRVIDFEPEPIVVEGPIEQIGGNDDTNWAFPNLVVMGHRFLANSETVIIDAEGDVIAFSDLSVGDLVRVEGVPQLPTFGDSENIRPEPVFVALEIKKLEDAPPVVLRGRIATIDSTGCFEMSNQNSPLTVLFQVCTNNETVILTEDGDPLTFADLGEGDHVRVEAVLQDARQVGPYLALEIVVLDNTPRPIVVEGLIDDMGPSIALYNGWIQVQGMQFLISPEAEILSPNGNELAVSDLAVGQTVRVEGLPLDPVVAPDRQEPPAPQYVAYRIQVLRDNQWPIETFLGVIAEFDPNNLCFLLEVRPPSHEATRYTICAAEDVIIKTEAGEPLEYADLSAGDRVEVIAEIIPVLAPVMRITALQITVFDNSNPEPDEFRGVIAEFDDNEPCFLIRTANTAGNADGLDVCTDSRTKIFGANGEELAYSDLAVGDLVEVLGVLTPTFAPPSRVEALEIYVIEHNDPEPITIMGVINEIDEAPEPYQALLVVNNRTVYVAPDADILNDEGDPISVSDLTVGEAVEVKAVPANGTNPPPGEDAAGNERPEFEPLVAIFIQILPRPNPEPEEIHGVVTAIEEGATCFEMATRFTDGETYSLRVCADDDTEIVFANRDEPAEFGDIEVGSHVTILAMPGDYTYFAVRIVIHGEDDPNRPVVAQGPIQEILPPNSAIPEDLGIVKVRGIPFLVSLNTEIITRDGTALRFDDLEPGMLVRAEGHTELDNTVDRQEEPARPVLADKITVLRNNPEPHPVSISGVVESVNQEAMQFVIRGHLIRANDETAVIGENGEPASFADITEGDYATVHGFWAENSTDRERVINAVEILLRQDPITPGQVEFVAAIANIDLEEGTLIAGGRLVVTDEETVFLDIQNNLISLEELAVGMVVEVEGFPVTSLASEGPFAVIQATKVEVERVDRLHFEAAGIIDTIEQDLWTLLDGTQFLTDEETNFRTRGGEEIDPDTLAPGDYIFVHGHVVPGELPVARVVIYEPELDGPDPCEGAIAFSGEVVAVDLENSTITVNEILVLVTNTTRLVAEGEGPVELADIVVGDLAMVRALGNASDTSVEACLVVIKDEVTPPPSQDYRVVGRVDAKDDEARTLSVRENTIEVTDETAIMSRHGEEIGFGDIEVGQMVDARGMMSADGVLVAERIRVLNENSHPRPVRPVRGFVSAVDIPNSFTLGQRSTVLLSNTTEFKDFDGRPIAAEALNVGDAVVVIPAEGTDATQYPRVISAAAVRVVAAVVESIDETEQIFEIGSGPVRVVEETALREFPGGEEFAFEDLLVGDLVVVSLSDAEVFPPMATLVVRVNRPEFSGDIPGLGPARPGHDGGRPTLGNRDPNNTFGFISLPPESALAEPDTLYEVRMRVSTNVLERLRVPTMRIRANMTNFEKGATLVVHPAASLRHVPTPEGVEHSLLFMPVADFVTEDAELGRFFASLDLLSFAQNVDPDAILRLDAIDILPIPADNISVLETLIEDNFLTGTEGWVYGGDESVFSMPRMGMDSGELRLAPRDGATFGYWTRDTGIVAEAGKTYRGRFLVYTSSNEPERVPTFRVRLNTSSFELASTVNVDAAGSLNETLRQDARLYDVYLQIPESASGEATILASFDLLNFNDESDVDATIILEQFFLEEIDIAE